MTDDLAIEAVGLTKTYDAVTVLSGLDLEVHRGSVFALLGPNGAGKTTTVRLLATLTTPDGAGRRWPDTTSSASARRCAAPSA